MEHVHIAALTFETERVLAAIREFPVSRFYLCQQVEEQPGFSPLAETRIASTLDNILDDGNVRIVQCGNDFARIYEALSKIVQEETGNGNRIYINLSSGTKIFTSAATLVGNQYDGVELYYVVPKQYYVERHYTTGVEKIIRLPALSTPPRRISVDSQLCFVAMPFSEKLQPIFEDAIRPLAEAKGMQCVRSDNFFAPRPIMDDIWESLQKARIVVSDLTGKNPNVFYETGIAHALGKEVVLLSQALDDVPFDLRHIRCVIYTDTHRGFEKLKVDLSSAIDAALERTTT